MPVCFGIHHDYLAGVHQDVNSDDSPAFAGMTLTGNLLLNVGDEIRLTSPGPEYIYIDSTDLLIGNSNTSATTTFTSDTISHSGSKLNIDASNIMEIDAANEITLNGNGSTIDVSVIGIDITGNTHVDGITKLGDGGTTNYVNVSAGGVITFNGTATLAHTSLSSVGVDDHHAQSHNIASHSDTTATGAELDTLTDNSLADALHRHDQLYESDNGAACLTADASGNLIATANFEIPATTSSIGQLKQNSNILLHTYTPSGVTHINLFIGVNSGRTDIVDTGATGYKGSGNVGFGSSALDALVDGYYNMCIGSNAGGAITSGDGNMCIGHSAGSTITTSDKNVAIGTEAIQLGNPTNGIGIGYRAMRSCTGANSTGIGAFAGYSSTSAYNNIYIGYAAGYRQTTEDNQLIISAYFFANKSAELANSIIYGTMTGTASTQTLVFNAGVTVDQTLYIKETASGGAADKAGYGQLYCKDNAGTTELWFVDDSGTETQLA